MRLALISDVHGNLPALEAVLDAIDRDAVDQVICLGDIVNAGPFPAECLEAVRALGGPVVQGNHEQYVLNSLANPRPDGQAWATVQWTRAQLTDAQLRYLDDLPLAHEPEFDSVPAALCVHASPASTAAGFLANLDDSAVAARMAGWDDVTLFAGHTHRPLYRRWSRSWIVNVGSVGMPLDNSITAKYCLAEATAAGWQIAFRSVAYDVDRTLDAFSRTGLLAAGGIFAALFRHQMATGEVVITDFLDAVRHFAQAQDLTMDEAIERFPAPSFLHRYGLVPAENDHA